MSNNRIAIQVPQGSKSNLCLLVNSDTRNIYLVNLNVHLHLRKVCNSNQRTVVTRAWCRRTNRSTVYRVHHNNRAITGRGDYTFICLINCVVIGRTSLLKRNLSTLKICLSRFNSRRTGRSICLLTVLAYLGDTVACRDQGRTSLADLILGCFYLLCGLTHRFVKLIIFNGKKFIALFNR